MTVLTDVSAITSLFLSAFLSSLSVLNARMTDSCCFPCLASADVSYMSRHASFRSLLKVSTSSLTSCMSSLTLKIDVGISCATALYHFLSFLTSVNSNSEFQTC